MVQGGKQHNEISIGSFLSYAIYFPLTNIDIFCRRYRWQPVSLVQVLPAK